MNNSSDFFNGNFIQINNNVSEEAMKTLLYIDQAGYFTSDNCPKDKRSREGNYFFMYVISGQGIVEYDNQSHTVMAGQSVFLDCSLPHNYVCDANDPWEVIWLSFGGNAAEYYYSRFTQKKFCIFVPHKPDNIQIIMTKIINNNLHKSEDTEIINAKLVTDLITAIITNYCIYEDDCINKFKHKLFSVKDYLDNNFTNPITLDMLADRFYISKFYLTREFKKEFGITIIQYLLAKKIEYAKELLIYTNKSVEEISETCGFNDQSYFSRQFKRLEKTTCLAYRRNHS